MALSSRLKATLRASLRLAIATALALAVTDWCGRGRYAFLAVIAVVLYVTDNRSLPLNQLLRQIGGGLVGILTSFVLFQVADGWFMLAVVLLVVALLVELLGLQAGRSMALQLSWGVLLMDPTRAFSIAKVFDYALSFVIGVLAARFVTTFVWSARPGAHIQALDQGIRRRLDSQVLQLRHWLEQGGAPPAPLASAELLPQVLELQQGPTRQLGMLWRQILRHWLLLEPQVLALPVPLPDHAAGLLAQRLVGISDGLLAEGDPPLPAASAGEFGDNLVALAIGQQLDTLDQLILSLALLRRSGRLERVLR